MTAIEQLQTELKGYMSSVEAMHEDLKAEKSSRDADKQTFETADALRKEQLETLTKKMDELEMSIARQKGMAQANDKLDEHTEKLWENYLKSKGSDVDRKAVKEAFDVYARKGIKHLGPEQEKLLSTQDNANGGYLLTPELDSQIDKILADISGVRSIARVSTTGTSLFEIVQRTARPTISIPGEGSTTSRSNSTYGKVTIPNKRYTARIGATVEEVQDSMWSLEAEARTDVAEELDYQQGLDFVSGTGVNEPEGLWTNTSIVSTVSGSAAAITYAGLVAVSHGDATNGDFNSNYLAGARFAMALSTLGKARLLEDTGGSLIFQVGIGDIENSILGFPYTVIPGAPVVAANAYPVMFGNFQKGYRIIDRLGMTMLTDPYTYAADGIIEYLFARRTGGKVVQPSVLRKLQCST